MTDDANLGTRRVRLNTWDIRRPSRLYDDAIQVTVLHSSLGERIRGAWWLLRGGDNRRKYRFVWNYTGHNGGLIDRGPNWWQLTIPPSRKRFRCALKSWTTWGSEAQ